MIAFGFGGGCSRSTFVIVEVCGSTFGGAGGSSAGEYYNVKNEA